MRIAYMDESGTNPRDSILVEAGVLVHGDEQVVPIEDHLQALIEKHIPADKREDFYFHAFDIYSGGDKKCIFHDKIEWPDERRWAILDDLVQIPAKFQLPIFAGIVEREHWPAKGAEKVHSRLEIEVARHAMAIIQCEIGVELFLRRKFPKEITHIIAEDNNDVRKAARGAHILLKNPKELEKEGMLDSRVFPFKKIRDGLQFTTKSESPLLQLADVCAWSIFRAGVNAPNAGRFFVPLMSQMVAEDLPDEPRL